MTPGGSGAGNGTTRSCACAGTSAGRFAAIAGHMAPRPKGVWSTSGPLQAARPGHRAPGTLTSFLTSIRSGTTRRSIRPRRVWVPAKQNDISDKSRQMPSSAWILLTSTRHDIAARDSRVRADIPPARYNVGYECKRRRFFRGT